MTISRKRIGLLALVGTLGLAGLAATPALTDTPADNAPQDVSPGITDVQAPTSTLNGQGTCVSIVPPIQTTGSIDGVDSVGSTITLNPDDGSDPITVSIATPTTITLDGNPAALTDLQPGQLINVDYNRCGDLLDILVADSVAATS